MDAFQQAHSLCIPFTPNLTPNMVQGGDFKPDNQQALESTHLGKRRQTHPSCSKFLGAKSDGLRSLPPLGKRDPPPGRHSRVRQASEHEAPQKELHTPRTPDQGMREKLFWSVPGTKKEASQWPPPSPTHTQQGCHHGQGHG